MNNIMKYVVFDWTKSDDYKKYDVYIIEQKELFELLNRAREDSKIKISVYELGQHLLDWS